MTSITDENQFDQGIYSIMYCLIYFRNDFINTNLNLMTI